MKPIICLLSFFGLLLVSGTERAAQVYHVGQRSVRYLDVDRERPIPVNCTENNHCYGFKLNDTGQFLEITEYGNTALIDEVL